MLYVPVAVIQSPYYRISYSEQSVTFVSKCHLSDAMRTNNIV
jgi:hypothetical protein